MRKIIIVLVAALSIGLLAVPAFAQTGSAADDVDPVTTERPPPPAEPGEPEPGDEPEDEPEVAIGDDRTEVGGVQLAQTGIEVSGAALLAVVLLGAGGAVLFVSRRRKASEQN